MISYEIDLSRYSDNDVVLLMVQQVITREEFEQWRANKTVKVKVTGPAIHSEPLPLPST